MYKFGTNLGQQGFLELREEGKAYLFCLGDCFDDGNDEDCMPLFSFSKRMTREDVEGLIAYLDGRLRR